MDFGAHQSSERTFIFWSVLESRTRDQDDSRGRLAAATAWPWRFEVSSGVELDARGKVRELGAEDGMGAVENDPAALAAHDAAGGRARDRSRKPGEVGEAIAEIVPRVS
jgi:hypothetical protein